MKTITQNKRTECMNLYSEKKHPWEEERPGFCKYTGKYCVGFGSPKIGAYLKNEDTPIAFSQDEMQRCPMYNLDFKLRFGKPLSNIVRKELDKGETK